MMLHAWLKRSRLGQLVSWAEYSEKLLSKVKHMGKREKSAG